MLITKKHVFVMLSICLLLLAAGCSKDKTTQPPAGDGSPIQMVDVSALVEQVAPPEYVGPSASPTTVDSAWLYGDWPLLDKVFGSNDPQTLYANIEDFKLSTSIIAHTLEVDNSGNVIPKTYVDSHMVDMQDGEMMLHFTAVVTALDNATAIPAAAQAVVGSAVDVDYLITISVDEQPNGQVRIGMTLNDTMQTILQWDAGMGDSNDEESRLTYASLDLRDSSFVFKGVGFCEHAVSQQWPNGDRFCWAYNITAAANADFAYRMSYFSNGTPGMTFLHCFLGGGNKDTEFALKYRMFSPADSTDYRSDWLKDQVFGPNYSEGTSLITEYNEYLSDELLFRNEDVPSAMLLNPWD